MKAVASSATMIERVVPEEGSARLAAQIGLVFFGTLILWASAKISVPFWPVPMTLQTGAVALLAAVYGWRLGTATVVAYLLEGALGMPVFTGSPEKGIGLLYMMGPTGGYLLGMVFQAAVVGFLAERLAARDPIRLFGAMLVGEVVLFACGLAWLGTLIGWDKPVLQLGLYPFVLGDLVKIALAAGLASAAGRLVRR
ncbi:biotin transporter BioY [Propylenella binzhouense]|uniref:Biotin transporter n=1 Tax=Propylenella binzhouense TaxID=2555902 RepID=A0A964T3Q0_9HYPH|nr:biotin transporter BioY [Propylenella binzhouense]MYZ47911.1 biotin transporter BioY [Propylenella binzhouense]